MGIRKNVVLQGWYVGDVRVVSNLIKRTYSPELHRNDWLMYNGIGIKL